MLLFFFLLLLVVLLLSALQVLARTCCCCRDTCSVGRTVNWLSYGCPCVWINLQRLTWLSKSPKTTMLFVVGLLFVLLLMELLFVCYKQSFSTTMFNA